MKRTNKLLIAAVLAVALPTSAMAAEVDLQAKIDKLSQQMEDLKGQVQRIEDKSLGKWLTIGGDYRFRVDSLHGETVAYTNAMAFQQIYAALIAGGAPPGPATMGTAMTMAQKPAYKPKNETLYTNRFGLDLKAKATKDVTVNVKLLAYKTFGSQDTSATTSTNFTDRVGVMDGTLGHVPSSSLLNVDRAYATWSNIMDQPVWFSVGRRPSTNGAPTNLKNNTERPGNGGTPALLVDYAFDGMTLGYAPDIDFLPGFYAKVCYGRGFDSGYQADPWGNSVKDTDMLGVAVIPVDTDLLRVWTQWNRGFNIFDFSQMASTTFGMATAPTQNLGYIDWFGAGAMSTIKKVGPGDLNFFADFGVSITHPNAKQGMMGGLLWGDGGLGSTETASVKEGYAVYTGVRYDLPSKTKLGFEYNYGSKNWITFAPAADDMWTAKVGTRGHVFEPYVIQELDLKPVSSAFSKAFFKLGYQYYDFEYTGSNNWQGAPVKISTIQPTDLLILNPIKKAHDIYATFEVHF